MIAIELPLAVTVQGALIGAMYGLLGVGLVLVYRSNRVVNFAQGELGALGAAVFSLAVGRWGTPYWLTLPIALAVSAAVGATAEVGVVRRLRNVPPIMTVIATLGLGQFLLLAASTVNPDAATGTAFPVPPWMPSFSVGSFRVSEAYSAMIVLAPLTVLGLAWFLRRGRFGRALRAAASNPDAARLDGVPAARMSTLAWALAGALAALTAILVSPTRGFVAASSFGPSLLLRSLAVAVLARMDRLGVAFGAGIVLGIVEQQVLWNSTTPGAVELVLFVVVVVGLLVMRPLGQRRATPVSWLTVRPWRPLPRELADLRSVRLLGPAVAIGAALAALVVLAFVTNAAAYSIVAILAFAVVGISVAITTGLLGELSLGMFAVGGAGAVVSIVLATQTGNFLLAFAAAALVGAAVAVVVGLPSLRTPGLLLTVTTLAFALAAALWGFERPWAFGDGERPGQPVIGSLRLDTGRSYGVLCVIVLLCVLAVAWNVRRSGLGRRFVAVRDNEAGARAFTLPARRVKAQGLALGGAVAGLGGALYAHSLPTVSARSFPVGSSIDVVAMAAIGGIGLMSGAILGALYIVGVPRFLPLDTAGLAATSLGWLLLLLYSPGGIARLVAPLRHRALRRLAGRSGVDPAVLDRGAPERASQASSGIALPAVDRAVTAAGLALSARGLQKRFGGVVAVAGVDLDVPQRSIVGLIGPNGAGKTTLFELLSGFTRPDAGTVVLHGKDVSSARPEQRADAGLVRSFQDAALFPSLTVHETVLLAAERRHPTRAGALIGIDRRRRARTAEADELLRSFGLSAWADIAVGELSTGTRRITELACLVALRPQVLLLDEPSAGLAQREVEAMADLLRRLRDEMGTSIVLIEHDIPLVMAVSDTVVAVAAGSVLRAGDPAEVRDDPAVVAAYLGDDRTSVERSGPLGG
jgi:ABC-type branched-subunit amino acid transport system ATPase component/ABC-type branched-subunit amino acid transport system permease subunit